MSVILNAGVYLGAYDLSAYMSQVEPTPNIAMQPSTTFASTGCSQPECGLESFALKGKIFLQADGTSAATYKSHDIIRAYWKQVDIPISWCPSGKTVGSLAGLFKSDLAEVAPAGKVGDIYAADFNATASSGIWVYGAVMATGAVSAGGNAAGQQLGAVTATQQVSGALHVMACTGTLTVTLQSDDNAGFTSPTPRLSFTAATGATYQWLSLAGPVTDTYWRALWTLPSGTATFVLTAGIR